VSDDATFPSWPPGVWRRIVLQPGPGWIGAVLEDDMHRMNLRLHHDGAHITALAAETLRAPWSACPGAGAFLAGELVGAELSEVAARDPSVHCTHLFDLAVLAAAHAHDTAPTTFDLRVADRVEERTSATLCVDGAEAMRWRLDGTLIEGPEPFAGRDLRALSRWKGELGTRDAERALLLRRAVYISGARQYNPPPMESAAQGGPLRLGVCFNYQLPQAAQSRRHAVWRRDFSGSGEQPLGGVDAARVLAAMG